MADEPCCECSNIEFKKDASSIARYVCHCDSCKAFVGGDYNDESFFNAEDVRAVNEDLINFKKSSAWWSPLTRGTCKTCGKPAISYADFKFKKFAIVPSLSIPNEIKRGEVCCHGFYASRVKDASDLAPKYKGFWSSQFMTLWYLLKDEHHKK